MEYERFWFFLEGFDQSQAEALSVDCRSTIDDGQNQLQNLAETIARINPDSAIGQQLAKLIEIRQRNHFTASSAPNIKFENGELITFDEVSASWMPLTFTTNDEEVVEQIKKQSQIFGQNSGSCRIWTYSAISERTKKKHGTNLGYIFSFLQREDGEITQEAFLPPQNPGGVLNIIAGATGTESVSFGQGELGILGVQVENLTQTLKQIKKEIENQSFSGSRQSVFGYAGASGGGGAGFVSATTDYDLQTTHYFAGGSAVSFGYAKQAEMKVNSVEDDEEEGEENEQVVHSSLFVVNEIKSEKKFKKREKVVTKKRNYLKFEKKLPEKVIPIETNRSPRLTRFATKQTLVEAGKWPTANSSKEKSLAVCATVIDIQAYRQAKQVAVSVAA